MLLKQVEEVIWRVYQNGVPEADKQKLRQQDILQQVKMAYGAMMRQAYYTSKAANDGQPDYYFYSPILSVQTFKLTDANSQGMRRAEMGNFDLYRLPKNSHFTNVYSNSSDCSKGQSGEITQVQPGEENFYAGNPDMIFFQFFVVKGRGINTYNLPTCVKEIDVEATYDGEDIDISNDIAFDIANQVLATDLKIKELFSPMELQKEIQKEAELK